MGRPGSSAAVWTVLRCADQRQERIPGQARVERGGHSAGSRAWAAQIRRIPALPVIRRAASRARGVAVAAGLDPLGPLRGGGEHLREGRHEPAGRVGVLAQLAQDRGELRRVDVVVGGEVVLDLLERELGDAHGGADALQPGAAHRRAPGRVVSQVVTAAEPMARWPRPAPSARCPAR
ncbi:hypothetical protein ACFVRU_00570 [Streptomyces sp. NPDC057927]